VVQDHEDKKTITKCKVIEFKMFYELLEITMIDFLHMSSLNSCGVAQWNQHLREHQQGWKWLKKSH